MQRTSDSFFSLLFLITTETTSSTSCTSSSSSIATPEIDVEFVTPTAASAVQEVREINVPYPFSHRFLDMLSDNPETLQSDSYADLSAKEKRRQHLLHGFSQVVDSYIKTHALEATWENRTTGHFDRVYFIPDQIK